MSKIIIIGGGIGGYNAALALAKGNQVTLIEKEKLGGTCLNKGCIPTKLYIHHAALKEKLDHIKQSSEKTVNDLVSGIKMLIDLKKIIYINDEARVEDNFVILKRGEKHDFDKLIIATGSENAMPEKLKGVAITSDDAIELEELPSRLTIIGGGYIGVEFAHIFNALGSKVCVIEKTEGILPAIDREAADIVARQMTLKGIEIITGRMAEKIEAGKVVLDDGREILHDKVLFCTGRKAKAIECQPALELESGFIKTNEYLQTSQPNIYAIGDCTQGPMLAHKAAYDAEIATANIEQAKKKKEYSRIPYCVFSEPAVAGIGEMDGQIHKTKFQIIGKAHCDESTEGFLKISVKEGKLAGAVVVNKNAAEILAALTIAVQMEATCKQLAEMTFMHPTSAEILKEAAKKAIA